MKLNVGVLGGGSWGTTVASLTAKNNETILWARNEKAVQEINEEHTKDLQFLFCKLYENYTFDYSGLLEYITQKAIDDITYI